MFFLGILLTSMVAQADTSISIEGVDVTASFKVRADMRTMPVSSSSFYLKDIERQQIKSIQDFAAATPNLHIPDYGSSITSSVYVRGIGSRIDNPSVGMYVDNMPFLNKNCFDAPLWDVRRIDVLRGPQGTLYGRNTIGGIITVTTLSPFDYTGTRISIDAGNGRTLRATAAFYSRPTNNFGFSLGLSAGHTGGFFTNQFTGDKCDWRNNGSARLRLMWKNMGHWQFDNSLTINISDEGGYAYAQLDTALRKPLPVAYNDTCGYQRLHIADGLVAQYNTSKISIRNVLSVQYLADDLHLDQDFTTKRMFTLQQKQEEYTISNELMFQNSDKTQAINWLSGISAFFKYNKMDAPVQFKADGIQELILDNANKGMHTVFPNDSLSFSEKEFTVESKFTTPTMGLATYGQAEYKISNFVLTAGLRVDYERVAFDYENSATVHYNFSYTMGNRFKPLTTAIDGNESQTFFEILPKLSAQYVINDQYIYASVSRGFKSGGYNTQMFSDILQNQMKADLMGDLGMRFENSLQGYPIDEVIDYQPEHDWNYEIGTHLSTDNRKFTADVALFYIICTDQQLTVFPAGKGTGRMMTNAGRTRSVGAETSLTAQPADWVKLSAGYGFTNATFTDYNNGLADFSGNRLPYVPQHTVSAQADFSQTIDGQFINTVSAQINYQGAGRIYWDDENSVWQDYYSLIGASVGTGGSKWNLQLWAKNIADTDFGTFHFTSVGRSFIAKGKPRRVGLTLRVTI